MLKKQTLLSDMTYSQTTHTTTQFYKLMRSIQNNNTKNGYVFACGTPQMFYSSFECTVEYSIIQQTTKIIILPQHPVFDLGQTN